MSLQDNTREMGMSDAEYAKAVESAKERDYSALSPEAAHTAEMMDAAMDFIKDSQEFGDDAEFHAPLAAYDPRRVVDLKSEEIAQIEENTRNRNYEDFTDETQDLLRFIDALQGEAAAEPFNEFDEYDSENQELLDSVSHSVEDEEF